MSTSKHSIRPITPADLPTMANFIVASKLQLAINHFVYKNWPNDPAQQAKSTDAARQSIEDPGDTCLKFTDDTTGEMVGYIVLSHMKVGAGTPSTDYVSKQLDQQQEVPDSYDPEVLPTVMKMIEEVRQQMKGIEHIRSFRPFAEPTSAQLITTTAEITHICLRPASRRQGVGSKLVERAIEMATTAGLPFAVASEPSAHDFFLRRGFRDKTHSEINLTQWAPPHCGWGIFRLSGMIMSP